jgi:hypothetical protein
MRILLQFSFVLFLASLISSVATAGMTATLVKAHVSHAADLVEIDAGSEAGMRLGMRANVVRENVFIATLVVVELRSSASIALIEVSSRDADFRVGDLVYINTSTFLSK